MTDSRRSKGRQWGEGPSSGWVLSLLEWRTNGGMLRGRGRGRERCGNGKRKEEEREVGNMHFWCEVPRFFCDKTVEFFFFFESGSRYSFVQSS